MSSEEAVVRGAFEALSEAARGATADRRVELTERWFHPEVEYSEDPSWPGSSTYHGRDAVRQAFEGYSEILAAELTVEDIAEGTDGFFARVHYRVTSTGADIPWEQNWGYHCRVRDGQLAYFRAFSDLDEALAAAGVDSP